MFSWRMRLHDARTACQNGRYDEAGALLSAANLREYLPAKQLAQQVAEKMLERAAGRFAMGDSAAGWHDLNAADRLGGKAEAVSRLRHNYVEKVLSEARTYLAAGQPLLAVARLDRLRDRGLTDERARAHREIGARMQEADALAASGHFAEAAAGLARAAVVATLPPQQPGIMDEVAARLQSERERLLAAADECRRLAAEMHQALSAEDWGTVLSAAESLIALAPQHVAARQARRRAWKVVGMDVTRVHAGGRMGGWQGARKPVALDRPVTGVLPRSTHASSRASEEDTVAGSNQPRRALLWIDAVGGFLVCLDDVIAIGQPSPSESLALPILADLSRRHAVIRRDAGAYVIDPLQRTRIDGREIKGPTVLADKQLIQLGDNVRIRFEKPHALSMTARLTIESHHKTQPTADAVLLMADSCVLGPNRHCHVRCREWQQDVVVFRQNDQVFCRADEPLTIDGVAAATGSAIESGARVEGESFSFAWETLGQKGTV